MWYSNNCCPLVNLMSHQQNTLHTSSCWEWICVDASHEDQPDFSSHWYRPFCCFSKLFFHVVYLRWCTAGFVSKPCCPCLSAFGQVCLAWLLTSVVVCVCVCVFVCQCCAQTRDWISVWERFWQRTEVADSSGAPRTPCKTLSWVCATVELSWT